MHNCILDYFKWLILIQGYFSIICGFPDELSNIPDFITVQEDSMTYTFVMNALTD